MQDLCLKIKILQLILLRYILSSFGRVALKKLSLLILFFSLITFSVNADGKTKFVCNGWSEGRLGENVRTSNDAFGVTFSDNNMQFSWQSLPLIFGYEKNETEKFTALIFHVDLSWPYTYFVSIDKMEPFKYSDLNTMNTIYITQVDGAGDDIFDLGIKHSKCSRF